MILIKTLDKNQIAVVCFPRPEDLKARSEKRLRETGKDVPVDAVSEMLGILSGGDYV